MDISYYLQSTCYFFSSKDNISNNGEQQPNQPCYQTGSSTTEFGIAQLTPNKPKTIDHTPLATIIKILKNNHK